MDNNNNKQGNLIEFTSEEFNALPMDRKRVVYGIERARDAAFWYREAYCAVVNAAHDVLCTDPVGYSWYDAIMEKTRKQRAKAEKTLAKDREAIDMSERIAAIKSWKKEVLARMAKKSGVAK